MVPLGADAPDFALPDLDGSIVRRDDFVQKNALLVAFICNHCRYTFHIKECFAKMAAEYQERGVGVVAINANDDTYAEDAPHLMAHDAKSFGFTFPYLYDESQEVARAFGAACTPDLFLYDGGLRLAYRGQFDETRPKNGAAHGSDLRAALDAVLAGTDPPSLQKPSMGCNIKWRSGREPDHFKPGPLYPVSRGLARVLSRLVTFGTKV